MAPARKLPRFLYTKVSHAIVFKKKYPLGDPGLFFRKLRGKGFTYELRPVMRINKEGNASQTNLGFAVRDTGAVEYDADTGKLTVRNQTTAGLLPSQVETDEIDEDHTGIGIQYSIEDLNLVRKVLVSDLEIGLSRAIKYIECILEAILVGRKSPLVAVNRRGSPPVLDELSAIFDEDLASFGVRIYPKRLLRTDTNIRGITDWYDMKIEPMITNPKQYLVNLVYRNKNQEGYLEFVNTLEKKITAVIRTVERD